MRLFLTLSIFVYSLFLFQPANAEKVFNAAHYRLENGLEVVVIPNNRVPVVTHMVWYRVGAADEPEGESGIAHFLEHLMFKGSNGLDPGPEDDLAPGAFSKIVRSLGGNDNAFTSQDYTAYFQSIAVEHLETVMRMEAGRMRGIAPPLEDIESERKVVLEERSQRTDNNPQRLMYEQLSEALYEAHPYGDPIIGWRAEIEALRWEDIKTFYDQYYAPNNAILVVSGDVTGPQILALAQDIYGPLARRPLPTRAYTKTYTKEKRTHIDYADPRVKQPTVSIAYVVPSYRLNPRDSLALQILQNIMGEGASSRLYKSLVIEQKIASGAGLSYRSNMWEESEVWLYATPLPGINLDDIKNALKAEIKAVIENGITDQELADAVSRLQDQAIYARDSITGPAMVIGYSLITGAKLDDVEYWPQNIAAITKEQIQDVAKKYLDENSTDFINSVSAYLKPAKAAEDE